MNSALISDARPTKESLMTDQLELEDEAKKGIYSSYRSANWRPKIGKRLFERVKLISAWIRLTVLPHYGRRAFASMLMITLGRLADAASFVAGTLILMSALSSGNISHEQVQQGLIWAAASVAGILAVGSLLNYFGSQLSVRLALAYESACLADGLGIIRHYQGTPLELTKEEVHSITRQAPRAMARSVTQIINLCTSMVLTTAGLAICFSVFPALTAIVLLSLVLLSPLYLVAALHSTNIGHSVRQSTPAHGATMRRFLGKWLSAPIFDRDEAMNEIRRDRDYNAYQNAYGARLTLSARNHALSSVTLAFVVTLSFVWIANEVEINAGSIAAIVSYLVSLRLFAHGLASVFNGIQTMNTLLPFYLLYLTRDPRFSKFTEHDAKKVEAVLRKRT
jgi:ABC-type multidrug transport system fused ATPase/permease subunit